MLVATFRRQSMATLCYDDFWETNSYTYNHKAMQTTKSGTILLYHSFLHIFWVLNFWTAFVFIKFSADFYQSMTNKIWSIKYKETFREFSNLWNILLSENRKLNSVVEKEREKKKTVIRIENYKGHQKNLFIFSF